MTGAHGKRNLPRREVSGRGTGLALSLWAPRAPRSRRQRRVASSVRRGSRRVKHCQLLKTPTPFSLPGPDSCACAGRRDRPLPDLASCGCGSAR